MDRESVVAWVAAYERAWREQDVDAVERLFAADARWRRSPYEPDEVGHAAIRGFWTEDGARPFDLDAEPIAIEGQRAVVRLEVRYQDPEQEYRDLWVLRFAADGRVEEYEEWPFWPGKGYAAE